MSYGADFLFFFFILLLLYWRELMRTDTTDVCQRHLIRFVSLRLNNMIGVHQFMAGSKVNVF